MKINYVLPKTLCRDAIYLCRDAIYRVLGSFLGDYNYIVSEDNSSSSADVWDALEDLAGTIDAPDDWASQHDHYLYGTPKRQPDITT